MSLQPPPPCAQPGADRPAMPQSYGLQSPTGGSGLMSWERVREQLVRARNYWIGTTRPDGRPHVMPVWGLWLDEQVWFSTARLSRKGRNLSHAPDVVVHLESGDDVVILEGTAQEVTDPARLSQFAEAYLAKYDLRPDVVDPLNLTYAVQVHTAFAWLESDFPGGATRWQF
jgi:nitroimidazol reductase NimA-like FMN-containing flavoprotein (pyridoxamine 5'-phosphate oxidase superfamily)